jgi:hypothetical protein
MSFYDCIHIQDFSRNEPSTAAVCSVLQFVSSYLMCLGQYLWKLDKFYYIDGCFIQYETTSRPHGEGIQPFTTKSVSFHYRKPKLP